MYNLRFYLDDNDNVIKCDYKHIAGKDELDVMFYDEIIESKNDLYRDFNILAKHDLNHNCIIKPNYIIHEFTVPAGIIKDLRAKMERYKAELETRRMERQQKFTNNPVPKATSTPTPRKKRKYVLNRSNKYKRRRVFAAVLCIVTLSSATIGTVKLGEKIYNNIHDTTQIVSEVETEDLQGYMGQLSAAQKDELIEQEKDREAQIHARAQELYDSYYDNTEISLEDLENSIRVANGELPVEGIQPTSVRQKEKYDYVLDIATDDWTETQKYIDCYNNYYPLIEKYANIYGIDPQVAFAVACHERGVHSNQTDSGGGLGLFQVQIDIWNGHPVRAYNFETNQWEEYTIYQENVCNLEENVKAGIMILQDCLRRDDYNIQMGVQEYNFGHGGLMTAMDAASSALGESIETLSQNDNYDWFDYRIYNRSSDGYQMGDPNYVENVFKYIENGEVLHFKTPDGENITFKYHNPNQELTRG